MKELTIGRLAETLEIGIETIRYYERRGLLPKAERSPAGYRQYSEESIPQVTFIRNAKGIGFSLREISELLSLKMQKDGRCADVKLKAEAKMREVEQKIASLQRIRGALRKLSAACDSRLPVKECHFLQALQDQWGQAKDSAALRCSMTAL